MQWFYDLIVFLTGLKGLLWFRTKVLFENGRKYRIKGGALVISNHIGFYDPIYIMFGIWYRRHHFVCMKEFFDRPFVGWFFRMCMCIPIDRDNMALDSFRKIVDILKAGKVVSMFPEGHVNLEEGHSQTFKSGMVLMALQSGVPIIPVALKKRKHFWNRLKIAVGEPIDIRTIAGGRPSLRQVDEIAQLLHDKEESIKKLLEEEK